MERILGRERAILLILAAVQFINIVDFMIVMPLGPILKDQLRLDPAQFGLIVSSYTFSACLAGLMAAFVIDRLDRRSAFLWLFLGFLVGTLLCGFAPSYGWLLAARILTGAFGGVLGGLALTIIGDIVPEARRGAATGVLMSAFAVASVLGVPLGIWLGNHYDWHMPFRALAAIGAAVFAVAAWTLPPLRGHLEKSGAGGTALERMLGTLTDRNHLRAFALVVTLMAGAFSVVPYIATYLVANTGMAPDDLFWVYVAGGAMTLVAAPAIGKLADRVGKLRVYLAVAPLSALLMLAVTHLPPVSLGVAVAVVALLMVCNSGRMVVAMAMVTACVEPRRRGSFMSLNSAVQHLASGLGAYVGGLILGETEGGALTHFGRVGFLAFGVTLLSLYVATTLRPGAASGPCPTVADPLEDPALAYAVPEPT